MSKKANRVSRRSFVALVTGAAASGMIGGSAKAQSGRTDSDSNDRSNYGYSGYTDGDSNDRSGHGRGNSCTDSDTGSNADGVGRGRRCGGQTGITDSDTGNGADGVGRGRGSGGKGKNAASGITDSDTGSNRDAVGRGRGTNNGYTDSDSNDRSGQGYSGLTDGDSNDRSGHGRGRGTGG